MLVPLFGLLARAAALPPLACMLGSAMQAAQVHAAPPADGTGLLRSNCLDVWVNAHGCPVRLSLPTPAAQVLGPWKVIVES